MAFIASDQNPLVKLARKLVRSAQERRKAGKTLLDGVHLIDAYASRFGLNSAHIIVSESAQRSPEIETLIARETRARLAVFPDALFRTIAPVETPTGIAALVDIPAFPAQKPSGESWLLLDGIQNPGNLGSILRTAAATGISRALLSTSCSDVWSPKCLRGGMGAQFILPCEYVNLVEAMDAYAGRCVATAPRQGRPLVELDLAGDTALIFGGEGAGLGSEILERADAIAHIPLTGDIDSLNVGAAVAICCYERLRQSLDR